VILICDKIAKPMPECCFPVFIKEAEKKVRVYQYNGFIWPFILTKQSLSILGVQIEFLQNVPKDKTTKLE
jgi:hypothetical protein